MNTKTLLMGSTFLLAAASVAAAAVSQGDQVGTTQEDIRAALEAEGYTVEAIEIDGDEFEVEALRGGVLVEIDVSSATGLIVDIEDEDDDDEDDVDEGDEEDGEDDDDDDDDEDDDDEDDDDQDDDEDDDDD